MDGGSRVAYWEGTNEPMGDQDTRKIFIAAEDGSTKTLMTDADHGIDCQGVGDVRLEDKTLWVGACGLYSASLADGVFKKEFNGTVRQILFTGTDLFLIAGYDLMMRTADGFVEVPGQEALADGAVYGIAADGDVLFAATERGLAVSESGRQPFVMRRSAIPERVSSIRVFGARIYVLPDTGGGIKRTFSYLVSGDQGKTFSPVSIPDPEPGEETPAEPLGVKSLYESDGKVYAMTTLDGIFMSADGGKSFAQVFESGGSAENLYVSGLNVVLQGFSSRYSSDGGANFLSLGFGGERLLTSGGSVYIPVRTASGTDYSCTFRGSDDQGGTFSDRGATLNCRSFRAAAEGERVAFVQGYVGVHDPQAELFTSDDGARSFSKSCDLDGSYHVAVRGEKILVGQEKDLRIAPFGTCNFQDKSAGAGLSGSYLNQIVVAGDKVLLLDNTGNITSGPAP